MHFESAFKTDVGSKRKQNQDNGQAIPEMGCFIVADGMGGHNGGETASALAVEVVASIIAKGVSLPGWDARHLLKNAIEKASEAIHARATSDPTLHQMGTTTVALLFQGGKVFIGNVGDSRCYYIRPGSICSSAAITPWFRKSFEQV